MIARAVIAIAAAGLLAVQVVRNAVVESRADGSPTVAAHWWPGHPAVEISAAMTGIAQAAHDRRSVPASTFPLMADAASKAPLAAEPFLVRGVQSQVAGDGLAAQRAFEAAQWRDPRSLAAAYFLAERYLRIGDNLRGLNEIAALSRLSPNGGTLAPYVASYARSPSNWPALRQMFRANPEFARPALMALASSIETVPAVLALARESDFHVDEETGLFFVNIFMTEETQSRYPPRYFDRPAARRYAAVNPGFRTNGCYAGFWFRFTRDNVLATTRAIAAKLFRPAAPR